MISCASKGMVVDCATARSYDENNNFCININHKKTLKNDNLLIFKVTTKSCMLCCENFKTQQLLDEHMLLYKYDHKDPNMYSTISGDSCFTLKMRISTVENSSFKITIKNQCNTKLNIMKVILLHPTNKFIKLFDENEIHDRISFYVDRQLMNSVNEEYNVYIFFNTTMCAIYKIKLSGKIPAFVKMSEMQLHNRLVSKRPLVLYALPSYYPSTTIVDLTNFNFDKNCKQLTQIHQNLLDKLENFRFQETKLDQNNYVESLKYFTEIEDCSISKKMYDFDKLDQILKSFGSYVKLNISNTKNHTPRLVLGARLYVQTMSQYNNQKDKKFIYDFNNQSEIITKKKFYGSINEIYSDFILIRFDNLDYMSSLDKNRYHVHFLNNRLTIQIQQHALELADVQQLGNIFFPIKSHNIKINENIVKFNWLNKNIINNPEQQTAIYNMVSGSCYPAPYILFGPPGTGKTSTLVEAISQLIILKKESQLLICAPTNSACNEITKRLLDYNSSKLILRVFAQSINEEDVNDAILDVSNIIYGGHIYPSIESLRKFPIIITTLAVAGRFVQARIDSKFFTHVIIDECGYATEPETLIPIAGLVTSFRKLEANIILAGDPKQLGPVLASPYAGRLGLNISMLERLMNTKLYQKSSRTNKYNNIYITKLIRNFRSNEHILSVSNRLFYNNELVACGDDKLINWSLQWKVLPNRKVPIIFHSSIGNTEKEQKETSLFNNAEINIVFKYLKLLVNKTINGKLIKEDDIGIISPYNKQCSKINEICIKRGWKNIEIGSVEKFQGREKSVIIMTLVRSRSRTIGFLNNPKRMNVALTRAQGLLIIIGDIETLQMDKHWRSLIKFCKSNNLVCYESVKSLTKEINKMKI